MTRRHVSKHLSLRQHSYERLSSKKQERRCVVTNRNGQVRSLVLRMRYSRSSKHAQKRVHQ